MAQDTAFLAVDGFVDCVVSIVYTLDSGETVVEIGLFELFAVAVDVPQTFGGVDRDEIRGYADMGAVLLVQVV
jgi:hypothetical protein